jgi:hypothetical protein
MPGAVDTVVCAPDDGWKYHPKHAEQFPDINKPCNVASFWIYIGILLGTHYILHISTIRVNKPTNVILFTNQLKLFLTRQTVCSVLVTMSRSTFFTLVKVKVNFIQEQAIKTQKVSRGIDLFVITMHEPTNVKSSNNISKWQMGYNSAFKRLIRNRLRLETRPPPHSHGNRRLRLQFERAPDYGHDGARNMLSGVCVTKQ